MAVITARSLLNKLGMLDNLHQANIVRKPSSMKVIMSGFRICGVCSSLLLALIIFMFTLFYLDVVHLVNTPVYSSGILLNAAAIRSLARLNAGFLYDEQSLALPSSSQVLFENYTQVDPSISEHLPNVTESLAANSTEIVSKLDSNRDLINATDLQEVVKGQQSISVSSIKDNATNVQPKDNGDKAIDVEQISIEEVTYEEKGGFKEGTGECNLYEGRWVQDLSYPLYDAEACPFIDPGFRCQENGRPDQDYLRWRWQPSGCDLPSGCYFQVGDHAKLDMDLNEGFNKAMQTWKSWVVKHVNLIEMQVFFRTYAPVHFSDGTWRTGGQCHAETQPWPESRRFEEEYWTNKNVVSAVESLQESGAGSSVRLLNITRLSNYRKDAHSSIYHVGRDESRPMHRQDCSHWCLPGLPDVWNQLLFASLSSSIFRS